MCEAQDIMSIDIIKKEDRKRMTKKISWKLEKGVPYPLGISRQADGVNFAIEVPQGQTCELVLYEKGKKGIFCKIPMSENHRFGNVLSVKIIDFPYENYEYKYNINGMECLDSRALSIAGRRKFGNFNQETLRQFCCNFWTKPFDWGDEKKPAHACSDTILYCMHVRGFTKHVSSKVSEKNRGTFQGVIEKIPYMLDLGINQIELMPVYEFIEQIAPEDISGSRYSKEPEQPRLNYWGYGKYHYYMAVKKSYAASEDERSELKELVKQLHRNGIEVILEFQFQDGMRICEMIECLRYWALEYHVDGFHLTGQQVLDKEFMEDPVLAACKLYGAYVQEQGKEGISAGEKRSAVYAVDYMRAMRSFLKGDAGKLSDVAYYMRRNGQKTGYVNYFTCHDGFTMCDMVSYDHKHNEDNEEGNRDGWDYNFSWNCGEEGKTRKKKVLDLRMRQMKNAWMMLMFGQGIPAFSAGDELCNSQNGNNNVYCQDNEVGWVNWKSPKCYEPMQEFVRRLIRLRKEHPVFHMEQEPVLTEERGIGYPAISFHSDKPWCTDYRIQNHYLGILYCGEYVKIGSESDEYFYLVLNMDWKIQRASLPKLPKNRHWELLVSSGKDMEDNKYEIVDKRIEIAPRTVQLYIGRQTQEKKHGERKKRT